jgi:hypothetical protein
VWCVNSRTSIVYCNDSVVEGRVVTTAFDPYLEQTASFAFPLAKAPVKTFIARHSMILVISTGNHRQKEWPTKIRDPKTPPKTLFIIFHRPPTPPFSSARLGVPKLACL